MIRSSIDPHPTSCELTDEELWSGLDRQKPEVLSHVSACPCCRDRAAQFDGGIRAVVSSATPATPPLPERIGSYTVRRRLAEGGMGIIYEAEQQTPRRPVAIKVVRGAHAADEYRRRLFQREAQTLARLRHPAIAAIYEAGRTEQGQDYLVMELVRGVPLTTFVRERNLPRRDRLDLFRRICDAINYAHQRGVIHRDLKPTNILVDTDGGPKVLDFGLARISDPQADSQTVTADAGRLMGTLPYMSPEEARGSPAEMDVRSDVYSLGVILFEMLTHTFPYRVTRTALPEAVRTICEEPPRRPSSIDRSLRGDLETIVLKALEKEPGRRYQSVSEFAADIGRYLSDQPILARRAGAAYHLRKFIVRHRVFVTFAVASFIIVLAARTWVDQLDQSNRSAIVHDIELMELRAAIIEHKLAGTLHASGQLDQAEPHYRRALDTFRRLGQSDRVASALVGLGTLLLQRPEPSQADYEYAEAVFQEAIPLLAAEPKANRDEKRLALEGLKRLYGPEVWDLEDLRLEVESKLQRLEAGDDAAEPARPAQ